ncbi:MAG: HAD family hydrolase [Thermoplasmatota archaeon]
MGPGLRAVFFDIDDTLYDFESSYHVALETVRREWEPLFGQFGPDAFRTLYWKAYGSIPQPVKDRLIREDLPAYHALLWGRVLELAGAPPVDPHPLARRAHQVRHDSMRPFEGARPLIDRLRGEAAVGVGVVTNGPGHLQRWKLEGLGLLECFPSSLVFVSGEVGCEKPDPRIFAMAVDASGARPEECVMIGDRTDTDMGAKAIGMRFILFDPGHAYTLHRKSPAPQPLPLGSAPAGVPFDVAGYQPDAVAHSYADVDRVIRAWCTGAGVAPSVARDRSSAGAAAGRANPTDG